MKTNYAVEFIATPSQVNALLADPVLSPLLLSAIANGVKPEWRENLGATRYCFQTGGATMVPDSALEVLVSMGVTVLFGNSGIYIEVPTSALDNLVPVSWPDARLPDIEATEGITVQGDRRQYQDYTLAIEGVNGTSLIRCGYIPNGMTGFIGYLSTEWSEGMSDTIDTPEIISLYREAFLSLGLIFHNGLAAWKVGNLSPDIR